MPSCLLPKSHAARDQVQARDLQNRVERLGSEISQLDTFGFTVDAAKKGNIGRFINHSCSPNLYAQNVLYDHEDKRIPHVMLFAMDNIPPLQELQLHDRSRRRFATVVLLSVPYWQ
ncbi:unnamed protein product [Thlaspi arvense]|uniref:SET domain-containing protein n=1 Tax=Thlaspi arvense TaxID=13288 RepID=A0AAU9SFR0_THLAR|nr:unnamed protein product [Thlaspi arvense]